MIKIDLSSYPADQLQKNLEKIPSGKFVTPVRKIPSHARASPSVLDGIYKIRLDNNIDVYQLCDSLNKLDHIIYAEPIFKEKLLDVPNDPAAQLDGDQGYLSVIKAYEAWDITKSKPDILIGIIDTGADLDHEDLESKIFINDDPLNGIDDDGNGFIDDLYGYDFADSDEIPEADGNQHGTHVSGIASAATNNDVGIAGVGYHARLSPLKIFTTSDNTSNNSYDAVQYAADNGYDIINLSWGSTNSYSQFNQDVINYAVLEKNVVVVAAAGNTPDDLVFYPASYENVLSVASTNLDDTKASFSTFNKNVDIAAPGSAIYSTQNGNTYGTDDGSSHSTPMVAGVAALVKDQYPELSAIQIMERIRVTADDIYEIDTNEIFKGKLGKGRLNALRAVSEDNPVSFRIKDPIITTKHTGGKIYFGDTVNVHATVQNYLDPAIDATVSLSASSIFGNSDEEIQFIEFLDTNEETTVGPFQIILDESTPPETKIEYQFNLEQGAQYQDIQIFDLTTEPDFLDLENDSIGITLAGNGNLAFADDPYNNGTGLVWNGVQILSHLGFVIAIDSSTVLDNMPGNLSEGTRDADFSTAKAIRPYDYPGASYTFNIFENSQSEITIEQNALIWDESPGDVVALDYRIVNTGVDTLYDVRIGLYADFDLGDMAKNKASSDPPNTMFISDEKDSLHAGIRTIGLNNAMVLLALSDTIEIVSDSLKYQWLTGSSSDSIGFDSLVNAATIQAISIDTLLPFGFGKVSFLISADTSLVDLENKLELADIRFTDFVNNPPVIETFISCNGGLVNIDPAFGDEFYFFSDVNATDTLSLADSLLVGPILGDSTFFVSGNDGLYPDPIRTIEVKLVENIANFTTNSDTFFLGDVPNNKLQFTDESFLPVSWQWDFGNGITASDIQNPSATYNEEGDYTVTLAIENEQGCNDQVSKSILVMERPAAPAIPDFSICEGQTASITAESYDTLRYYLSPNSTTFISQGSAVYVEGIQGDTTVYVTGLINNIESAKEPVNISIEKVSTDFQIIPLLDSLDQNYLLLRTEADFDSISWSLDGSYIGNSSSVSFVPTKNQYLLDLFITSPMGCPSQLSDTLTLSESPLPEISLPAICSGDTITITPANGNTFWFFADSSLTQGIHKGSEITVNQVVTDTTIYVVGLDSLLPGNPLELALSPANFEFNIEVDPDTLILEDGRQVNLGVDVNSGTFQWFVDGEIEGIGPELILFFDSARTHSILVTGKDENGCSSVDSIHLVVLEEKPEILLNTPISYGIKVFPNPVKNELIIKSDHLIRKTLLTDLSGKVLVIHRTSTARMNMGHLPDGVYLLYIHLENGTVRNVRVLVSQ